MPKPLAGFGAAWQAANALIADATDRQDDLTLFPLAKDAPAQKPDSLRKFLNVDLETVLPQIMKQKTAFYQTDLNYALDAMREGAASGDPAKQNFVLIFRQSGVECFPYFCPPGRSEIACWEVSQTLYENGKERKTMNGRKRTVQVKFYVTEEERSLIEEKMKLVPTNNMAAYLRKIAIDGYIIQVDHTDIKAMTAEIRGYYSQIPGLCTALCRQPRPNAPNRILSRGGISSRSCLWCR